MDNGGEELSGSDLMSCERERDERSNWKWKLLKIFLEDFFFFVDFL